MAYQHLTASGNAQVYQVKGAQPLRVARIVVNTGLTGTITVTDSDGTNTNGVVGVITNPVPGNTFEYWSLRYGLQVNPSGTVDITVNYEASNGPHR